MSTDPENPDIAALADTDPDEITQSQVIEGSDWFLSQEVEPVAWDVFDLNVAGDPNHPKWVRFRVESIDRDILKQIQVDATDDKTGLENEVLSNEFLAIQGLTSPNLSDEKQRGSYADPRDALRHMFGHKPLLIDTIARRVMAVSGGDMTLVRNVPEKDRARYANAAVVPTPSAAEEASAAGN